MTVTWRGLGRQEIDHERLWSLVGLVALGAGLALVRMVDDLPLGCAFKAVTGWPCLTCGSTRAMVALSRGLVRAAFRDNPLVTAVVVAWVAYVPYGLGVSTLCARRLRVSLTARECAGLRILTLGAVAATWIFLIVDGR